MKAVAVCPRARDSCSKRFSVCISSAHCFSVAAFGFQRTPAGSSCTEYSRTRSNCSYSSISRLRSPVVIGPLWLESRLSLVSLPNESEPNNGDQQGRACVPEATDQSEQDIALP